MKISCEIIQDLIPLVNDGVASQESEQFVIQHCKECQECQSMLDRVPKMDEVKINKQWKKRIRLSMLGFVLLLSLMACTFSATMHQFQNFILIPIIGALGYHLLRKKVYYIYLFIIISHLIIHYIVQSLGTGIVFYTIIYWILLSIGIIIYQCFEYAFRDSLQKWRKRQ